MIYDDLPVLKVKGVSCKSDAALFSGGRGYFLSIYGSPQQVRAIFAQFIQGTEITAVTGADTFCFSRGCGDGIHYRFRGCSISYGKYHGLIWLEDIGERLIIWASPEERTRALRMAFSRRRVPFLDEWLSGIGNMLVEKEYLEKLNGWGDLGGYFIASWNDDEICNLVASGFLMKKRAAA